MQVEIEDDDILLLGLNAVPLDALLLVFEEDLPLQTSSEQGNHAFFNVLGRAVTSTTLHCLLWLIHSFSFVLNLIIKQTRIELNSLWTNVGKKQSPQLFIFPDHLCIEDISWLYHLDTHSVVSRFSLLNYDKPI
jgi:hypothetical protein